MLSIAMRIASLARPSVLSQPVYEPGKPIDYVARELGLDPAGIIKLASNENPFGPSPRAVEAATRALAQGALYPDGGCYELRQRLASFHGLGSDQFVVGNGSNELIELLGHVFLGPGDEVVMANPAFVVYKLVTLLFGAKPVEVPLRNWTHDLPAMAAAVTPRTKLVCVCSPNNPTGTANSGAELEAFIRSLPDHVVVVIDEAYVEYLENPPDLKPLIRAGKNLICLRTFSKIHGLAALRVGFGYAAAELCGLLNRVRQPFNVNAIGQAAAIAALDDVDFPARCARETRAGLLWLEGEFRRLGLETVPSSANFLLVRTGDGLSSFKTMQASGIIVRPMHAYGLSEWVRVTVGTTEQNRRLVALISSCALPSRSPEVKDA
ncbi:MAG: histidinol-phosphate transaminase [Opitutaceae bacterium]